MTGNEVINCTGLISTYNMESFMKGVGTYFFAKYKSRLYMITCAHALENKHNVETLIKIRKESVVNRFSALSFPVMNNFNIDYQHDVAIIPLEDILAKYLGGENVIINTFVNFDQVEELDIEHETIHEIIACGYPLEMMDEFNNFPIVLSGVTSTPISKDINPTGTFLSNLHAYQGSSGSPVFVKTKDAYEFVGMQCSVKALPCFEKLVESTTEELKDTYGNIALTNISGVVNYKVILDLIKLT